MPLPGNRYQYRLIDGDVTGKKSTNGVFINGQLCNERKLQTGDKIMLGESVQMSYLIAQMTQAEFDQYFNADSPQFHSLKEESLDPTGTLMTIIAN
ncbi:MAG: FHA domain-containing protein [Acaryochloridaceae cyanobacterium RL_2_7]|nr:FHA domain-containing protein [Acaryochloridaceae cyanobacterium RL_2_7]